MTDKDLADQLSEYLLRLDQLAARGPQTPSRDKLLHDAAKASEHLLSYLTSLCLLTPVVGPDSAAVGESRIDECGPNAQTPKEPITDREFADRTCELLLRLDALTARKPISVTRDKLVRAASNALTALVSYLIVKNRTDEPRRQ